MSEPKIVLYGGNKLEGEIQLSGAKNAALPMLVAACLGEEPTVLENVPLGLNDVQVMLTILRRIGANVDNVSNDSVTLCKGDMTSKMLPLDCVGKIRSSLLLLGLFSGLGNEFFLPLPGGCNIGKRDYDLHLSGLKRLGVTIHEDKDGILASASKLNGTDIEFYLPTTTGTQNVILAALFSEGETIIKNANTRPENIELTKLLNSMGAKIEAKNRVVKINGVKKLKGGIHFKVMPGWDEAVTYMVAAGTTQGQVVIKNIDTRYMKSDIKMLKEAGVEVFEWSDSLYIKSMPSLKSFDLFTSPYPGINSDMQPIFAALALASNGESTITDMRFTDRFAYVDELKKFGAAIEAYGNCAVIAGGKELVGADVRATDLRAGAAEIICGLLAKGKTTIRNIYQIERGYENIVEKLKNLGANIKRTAD